MPWSCMQKTPTEPHRARTHAEQLRGRAAGQQVQRERVRVAAAECVPGDLRTQL